MKMKFYGIKDIDKLPQLEKIPASEKFAMKVVANVLPFRANNYVVDELIDWDNYQDDPVYKLTFMQKEMLSPSQYKKMALALQNDASTEEVRNIANEIRKELNPHPAGQLTANVPFMDEEPVRGIQHKYRETCLVFPQAGQTCFAYCTFCFRWPQFVGMEDLKFATKESGRFQDYLKQHKEITDVILTGGDPMIMNAKKLTAYIEPLLGPGFEHIQNIRIGTKVLSYWPYRFLTDKDSQDILDLFTKVTDAGKHLAFMAHINHPQEQKTESFKKAVIAIRKTGATIRSQAPVLKGINDNADQWADMWREQVQLGIIPYYMFVERDTGPKAFFEIPLADAIEIYQKAIQQVSGIARTVRGPSMSCLPGKVAVDGITEINGEKAFVLSFLQGRNSDWCKRPFFAKFDPAATWFDDLEPIEGEFFFQRELDSLLANKERPWETELSSSPTSSLADEAYYPKSDRFLSSLQ